MHEGTRRCALCHEEFAAGSARNKFCGRPCSQASRLGLSGPVCCADCGARMEVGRGSRVDGTGRCISCRRADPTHGVNRYTKHGCRCDVCKSAMKMQARRFNAKWRSDHGVAYATTWKARRREETGQWPHEPGGWISRRRRLAIYERDGWTCHLCGEAVSREYDSHDPESPTLDHLVPRALGGSDDAGNLRTAHAICNARRGKRPLEVLAKEG